MKKKKTSPIRSFGKIKILFTALVFWCTTGFAGNNINVASPEQESWLVHSYQDINSYIRDNAAGGIIGISVKDLITGEYVSINGNVSFNPASVIKVPVMAYAFELAARNKLSLDKMFTLHNANRVSGCGLLFFRRSGSRFTVRELIDRMITESDNTATKMLIDNLGRENINKFMKRIGLNHTEIRDSTMLSKAPGRQNVTTPDDMLALLDMMYSGNLINAAASKRMLDIMSAQKHDWGIRRYLPAGLRIANKTGSLDMVRNDVGIVFMKERPYIITIFARQIPSNHNATLFVRNISKIVYEKAVQKRAATVPGWNRDKA